VRVSQRLDYGLRAAVHIAAQPSGKAVAAGDVAQVLGLPRRFVEQQVTALARAGLVVCRRGAGGGCTLARPPAEISVADVVDALEGATLDVPHVTGSVASEVWANAADHLRSALSAVTLADLVERQAELDADRGPEYVI